MLDIKFIRENKDIITAGSRKKHIDFNVEALLTVDDKRKELTQSIEKKRAEQNIVSDKMVSASANEKVTMITDMTRLKDGLKEEEAELARVMKEWQALMVTVPNVPDMSVPEGQNDTHNVEVKAWGEKPKFSFEAKNHIEIMEALDMVDLERGSKVAGFRGYFLKNDGVRLSFAIWNFALDFFSKHGFNPMIVPSLVRRENLFGSGYLPQGEDDLYQTQDGEFLAGTAEVATMGYFANDVLDKKDLPIKKLSFSPCFRREAGAHSKDVKGLIRVHEFYKWEQVVLCEASHEASVIQHDMLNRNTEEFIEALAIPYHTVVNCGGDLGLGQVKKYDIELWVPLEKKYREISSASYFHDFQTRRLGIKYKDEDGKLKYVHSLNSTAIPTPRILVSLIENYQQEDGSIKIPDVLVPYMGGKTEIAIGSRQ